MSQTTALADVSKPQLNKLSGSTWELVLGPLDLDTKKKLEDVPGLRIAPNGTISGFVDAVAAACLRLGMEPPPPFGALTTNALKHTHLSGLRDYQAQGVTMLMNIASKVGGALLADEMGLGKTRQAIEFSRIMAGAAGRVLICAPAFVRETWAKELMDVGVDESSIVKAVPSGAKGYAKEWGNMATARWIITSYELVEKAHDAAFRNQFPSVVVIDEAHYLCGRGRGHRGTKPSQRVESVAVLANYRLALTATPAYDRPRDFYRLLKILYGNRFGTPTEFDFAYCGGRLNEHGGLENKGVTNAPELRKRISYYMVRRQKVDVAKELPPLTRQIVWVDGDQASIVAAHNAMIAGGGEGRTHDALLATLDGKMDAACELAKQTDGRFLLFTWLKDHARQMAAKLDGEGTKCVCVTGDMTVPARMTAVNLATQNGWGIVATIDSLGTGVNLQGVASVGIMHAIDWRPNKLLQAEARLHRLGQKEPVQWLYVAMKDSMDAPVIKTVVNKLDALSAVMSGAGGTALRDSLDSNVNGAGVNEEDLLKSIYESME